MTLSEFLESYKNGQRHFVELDFECVDGFKNSNFSNAIFEKCFLYVDFTNSNLTNTVFFNCNLKMVDFTNVNFTNATLKNCSIESAIFKNVIIENFKFIENYYCGSILNQEDFETLKNSFD
ncbi:MAG: hypothetical protein EOP00_18230 [Pedobacter sp.]|nr:MAG: hypothetical protein EOP00_18230 [Pedobacter sp.]